MIYNKGSASYMRPFSLPMQFERGEDKNHTVIKYPYFITWDEKGSASGKFPKLGDKELGNFHVAIAPLRLSSQKAFDGDGVEIDFQSLWSLEYNDNLYLVGMLSTHKSLFEFSSQLKGEEKEDSKYWEIEFSQKNLVVISTGNKFLKEFAKTIHDSGSVLGKTTLRFELDPGDIDTEKLKEGLNSESYFEWRGCDITSADPESADDFEVTKVVLKRKGLYVPQGIRELPQFVNKILSQKIDEMFPSSGNTNKRGNSSSRRMSAADILEDRHSALVAILENEIGIKLPGKKSSKVEMVEILKKLDSLNLSIVRYSIGLLGIDSHFLDLLLDRSMVPQSDSQSTPQNAPFDGDYSEDTRYSRKNLEGFIISLQREGCPTIPSDFFPLESSDSWISSFVDILKDLDNKGESWKTLFLESTRDKVNEELGKDYDSIVQASDEELVKIRFGVIPTVSEVSSV